MQTKLSTEATLDARSLQQQQVLLEQRRQLLLLQQQRLAARQQEMARRPLTPSDAGLTSTSGGVSSYQMQSMMLTRQQQQQQQQIPSYSETVATPTPNLMAAEEIRVDCIQLTANSRYVVTASIYGPPQVWDLKVAHRCCNL